MSIRLFSLPGYSHLYRSLLRFADMDTREARGLVYALNTANLDSFRYMNPRAFVRESGYVEFCGSLHAMNRRPYRTEIQLYKALAALKRNIIPAALTAEQREALAALRYLMRRLEYRFYKAFGVEIYDMLTVYSLCADGLAPDRWEPGVCLMRELVFTV